MARGSSAQASSNFSEIYEHGQSGTASLRPVTERSTQTQISMQMVEEVLSGNSKAVWSAPQIRTFMLDAVSEVIERRKLRKSHMIAPKAELVMPALEVLRYSPLKGEIACLIASSMDRRKTEECLPAFVDILKQITVDEARLISRLPGANHAVPSATVNYVDQVGRLYKCVRHVLPAKLAAECEQPSLISSYVDNLLRLGVLTQPDNITINDNQHYQALTNQPFLRQVAATAPRRVSVDVHRSVVTLSDLGANFRACCLEV